MKKLTFILAFVLLASAVSAQSINISNAVEQMNRGYLKKAKDYIDKACAHEETADSPKAWYYSARIYFTIGDEIQKGSKKANELKALAPYWHKDCLNAALTCQKLDTKGEYTELISNIISYMGSVYYGFASAAYEKQDFEKAIVYCDSAIIANSISGKDFLPQSYYLAGLCCTRLKDNAKAKNYYNYLVRTRNKKYMSVYESLYRIYVEEKDTVNAVKTAESFVKVAPDTVYQADMLASQAYRLSGNNEKSQEYMNKALQKVHNDNDKAILLCAIGATYDNNDEYDAAEKCYKESLALVPNQLNANSGLALVYYNKGVGKFNAANNLDYSDESAALYDQLVDEYKALFRQCVEYAKIGVAYIDGLPVEQKAKLRGSLHTCLTVLKNAAQRLEMVDEYTAAEKRIKEIEAGN